MKRHDVHNAGAISANASGTNGLSMKDPDNHLRPHDQPATCSRSHECTENAHRPWRHRVLGLGMKFRKPFEPENKETSPSRIRAMGGDQNGTSPFAEQLATPSVRVWSWPS